MRTKTRRFDPSIFPCCPGIRGLRVEPEPAGDRLGPLHLPPPHLRQDQPRRRALRHPHGRHHRPHLHRHDDALLLEHEVLSLRGRVPQF